MVKKMAIKSPYNAHFRAKQRQVHDSNLSYLYMIILQKLKIQFMNSPFVCKQLCAHYAHSESLQHL